VRRAVGASLDKDTRPEALPAAGRGALVLDSLRRTHGGAVSGGVVRVEAMGACAINIESARCCGLSRSERSVGGPQVAQPVVNCS